MGKIKRLFFSLAIVVLLFTAVGFSSAAQARITSFTDVKDAAWYYDDITSLASKGIVNGYPNGSFRPNRTITTAEFTKIIVNAIGGTIDYSSELYDQTMYDSHWADSYIDLAINFGIVDFTEINDGFYLPDEPITRAYMTKLLMRSLGLEASYMKESPFADETDGWALTAYNEYLLRGYVTTDGTREYRGAKTATRAEAVSMIVRAVEYRRDPPFFRTNAIFQNADANVLNTEFELLDLFTVMNASMVKRISFRSDLPIMKISEYYRLANSMFPQFFYGSYISFYYNTADGRYIIEIEYTADDRKILEYKTQAELASAKIASEIITEGMSDRDKLLAIHDYLLLNCEYDYENYLEGTIPLESYLAYGVFVEGRAVCQGYSAAFNMLCKEAGIKSLMIAGTKDSADYDNHAWNMVMLDGTIYFIDVTSDDPVPDVADRVMHTYFLILPEEMYKYGYSWNIAAVSRVYFTLARIN